MRSPQPNEAGQHAAGRLFGLDPKSGNLSLCAGFPRLTIGCPVFVGTVAGDSAGFGSASFGSTFTSEATFADPFPIPISPAIRIGPGEVFFGVYNASEKGQPGEFVVNLKLVETIVGLTQKIAQLEKEVTTLQTEMTAVKKKIGI